MSEEEENARAVEYRRQAQARLNHRARSERALRGSEAQRRINLRNWQPIIMRDVGWDPHDPLNGKEAQ